MSLLLLSPKRMGHLFASDAMNISRDPTLVFASLFCVAPILAGFIWRDAINGAAFEAFGITDFFRYCLPLFIGLPAYLIGWVTGFLFLEDRDEGTLLVIDVTPLRKQGMMAYRVTVTAAVAVVISLIGWALLLPEAGPEIGLTVAAMIALQAVMAGLILPVLARNKVEGLAITKLTNIASIAPLIAIIPSPFRYLGAVVPSFWLGELLGISQVAYLPIPVIIVAGLASHVVVALALYRLLVRRAG